MQSIYSEYSFPENYCQNKWKQLGFTLPTADSQDFEDTSNDDDEFYINVRKGLGLSFWMSTRRSIYYKFCTNKCHSCKKEDCYHSTSNGYKYCDNISFVCPICNKTLYVGDFHIDHINSFQRYWESLKRVDVSSIHAWYNNIDNLQILCASCNCSKGAN